ncbi:MAG: undecaprenyl/decaprenyl-phosphate alpha-N-acetylglucosaminyl 1-phosphate transferase [Chthonomonas sp.]|nr:undecaprenyl/decaprenyl-phosphate alpha-N-acetylglucosaminyl 1-phosphate transferase [Chthonomonas sp.]
MNFLAATVTNSPLRGFGTALLAGAIALVITWALTPWVMKLAIAKGAVDDPTRDDRRVHTKITPRWGGFAIFAGALISVLICLPLRWPVQPFAPWVIGLLGLGAVITLAGAADDLHQFSAKIQMGILLAAGVAVQFFGSGTNKVQVQGISWPMFSDGAHWIAFAPYVAIPLTAVYIFVVTKTMDTIDGIDGLAAGIAAISAATLAIVGVGVQPRVALIAAAVAGSAIGFLRHNYNPAKIFMGTGGAQFLGFTLACLSIVGAMKTAATIMLIIPIFVFGVPIFDAFFVVTRRLLSGQPITAPDKRHLHHTLLRKGLDQRQTVLVLYAVAAVLGGIVVVAARALG